MKLTAWVPAERLARFYDKNVKHKGDTNQNSNEFLHKASLLSQGVPTAKQCSFDNYNRYDRKCQLSASFCALTDGKRAGIMII